MKKVIIALSIVIIIILGYLVLRPKQIIIPTAPAVTTETTQPVTQTSPAAQSTQTPAVSTTLPEYIGAQAGWPPVVTHSSDAYVCNVGIGNKDMDEQTIEKTINGKKYCIHSTSDGTAGTTYWTYDYSTVSGSGISKTSFTLGYPDCGVFYGSDALTQCNIAQANFDIDAVVADMMTNTITQAASTAGWKIYTNTRYGFSLQYPSDGAYSNAYSINTPNIIIASDSSNINSNGCYKEVSVGDGSELSGTNVKINGVSYCHTYSSDGGAGHFEGNSVYTLFRNGMYITFDYKLGFSNDCSVDNTCGSGITRNDFIQNIVQQSIATLTFK